MFVVACMFVMIWWVWSLTGKICDSVNASSGEYLAAVEACHQRQQQNLRRARAAAPSQVLIPGPRRGSPGSSTESSSQYIESGFNSTGDGHGHVTLTMEPSAMRPDEEQQLPAYEEPPSYFESLYLLYS